MSSISKLLSLKNSVEAEFSGNDSASAELEPNLDKTDFGFGLTGAETSGESKFRPNSSASFGIYYVENKGILS